MATIIVGTNSYASLADADAYFDASIRAATWAAFTEEQKTQGLLEATRQMERASYKGEKEVSSQALAFPRTGLTDCAGNAVTPAESLQLASEAEFEYALALLQDPGLLNRTTANAAGNTKRLKAGSAEIEYFRPQMSGRYPTTVNDILRCFLTGGSGGGVVGSGSVVSGNDGTSSFSQDNYKRDRGYY